MRVPAGDLKLQYHAIRDEIDAAVREVLESGWYILGRQLEAFETEFAAYCGVAHAVGVGSGTDALHLALMACDVGPGDEVITTPTSAMATVSAIQMAGATPVFVDVDPATLTLDPDAAAAAITPRTRALLPVHLYGHPAAIGPLAALGERHGLALIEDCAQAHGARFEGRLVGTFGVAGCFSFYPTKNLGALGDAGAIVTRDAALAERMRMLRNYGEQPGKRYHHVIPGVNSRLDEMQAAILRVKLRHLDDWNEQRRAIAAGYSAGIRNAAVRPPTEQPWARQVCHLFVVRSPYRDALRDHLARHEVGTQIHYPVPLHLQAAVAGRGDRGEPTFGPRGRRGDLPNAERAAAEVLSLPIYPELTEGQRRHVVDAVNAFAP
jgi:dTDP-4-amino-4,6-dideoxygalactose transaminase